MPQNPYARGNYSRGICDRCGFKYPLKELKLESLAAKGVQSDLSSELRVCRTCFDEPHPVSFLPRVASRGADPQQLWKPRPEVFPVAYSVVYRPNMLTQNTSGVQVIATTVYTHGKLSLVSDDPGISAQSIHPMGATKILIVMDTGSSVSIGQHVIGIVDGSGQELRGLMTVLQGSVSGLFDTDMFGSVPFGPPPSSTPASQPGDGLFGDEEFGEGEFGGPN